MPKPRTWLFIGLGVLALFIGGALAVVGAGAWFFASHVRVEKADQGKAEESFDAVRQRFAGQAPLISIDAKGAVSFEELERRRGTYRGVLPENLCVLAWKRGEGKVVRLSFPFWLLRFQGDSSMKIDVEGLHFENLHVDHEDLRMAGPALLLDFERDGSRVLMWTE
jgi:hypothetical protein